LLDTGSTKYYPSFLPSNPLLLLSFVHSTDNRIDGSVSNAESVAFEDTLPSERFRTSFPYFFVNDEENILQKASSSLHQLIYIYIGSISFIELMKMRNLFFPPSFVVIGTMFLYSFS